jgi:diketogulonate reductase-like aldo/keto reductase
MHTLNDGTQLPAIGFGTYPLRGAGCVAAIVSAIETGYRLIDSAYNYGNETEVGEAVRAAGVPREELVITSKLPGRFHAHDDAVAAVEESLRHMALDRIDLYLIHWPLPRQGRFVEAFAALVECRERGLVRSVGVSNFLPEHVDAVIAATGVVPSVNQVELHPRFPQAAQLAHDEPLGIRLEAWSPLGKGSGVVDHPTVTAIAAAHGRTPAQVILRWDVERGVVPLPKAATPARQAENLAVFDFSLTHDEVAAITAIGRPDGRLWGADPATHEEF